MAKKNKKGMRNFIIIMIIFVVITSIDGDDKKTGFGCFNGNGCIPNCNNAPNVCGGVTFADSCGNADACEGIKDCITPTCEWVSEEPTTREQLIQWGSQLKLQGGIWGSSEPFLLFPEKESACSNGYFPCLPSEMDNMPIENMLCNEFYNYIISSQGNWEIYQEIHNKKVYRQILGDEYYALCIENDKIAINTGYMEVINEYFNEFYTEVCT